jgi:protein-S-isoprenylcysteine O-methyltransferase Ste14
MTPLNAMIAAWSLWMATWLIAALWSDPAAKRSTFREQWRYWIVTMAGVVLLFGRYSSRSYGGGELWDLGFGTNAALVAVAALGLLFTWWARIYLGRLWSSSVTRKADHIVVDTGPYGIVRHPIYTGIIAAALATALVKGTPYAIVGALLMSFGFWIKAALEERFLREHLGADAYDSYRRRVPMLIPFGPTSA